MSNDTISHLSTGDSVSPESVSAVTRALENRLLELENLVLALSGGDQIEYLNNVQVSSAVQSYSMVYYNPSTQLYEPAIALAVLSPEGASPVQSSYCCGMVVNVEGGFADLAYNGVLLHMTDILDDSSKARQLLEPGIEWVPGRRYFLSETHPGRVTHRQTALEICVGRSGKNEFFVDLNEQPPQVMSSTERTAVAMRPVGDLRAAEQNSDYQRIVAFDGIEYDIGNSEWISTRDSVDPVIQGNGWLRADLRWDVNANERVNQILIVHCEAGIADLNYWLVESLDLWGGTSSDPSGTLLSMTNGHIENLTLLDSAGQISAVLSLGLTSNNAATDRLAVLRIPDCLIGWKEMDEPDSRPDYTFYWEGSDGRIFPVYVENGYPNQAFEVLGEDTLRPVEEGDDFYESGTNPDQYWEWADGSMGRLVPTDNGTFFSRLSIPNTSLPEVQCALSTYRETFPDIAAYPLPATPVFNAAKILAANPGDLSKTREYRMVQLTAVTGNVNMPEGLAIGVTLVGVHADPIQNRTYPVVGVMSDQYLVLDMEDRSSGHELDLANFTYKVVIDLDPDPDDEIAVTLEEWIDNLALWWSVLKSDELLDPTLRNSLIRVTGSDGTDISNDIRRGFVLDARAWGVIGQTYLVANVQYLEMEYGAAFQVFRTPMYYYNVPTDLPLKARWPRYDTGGTVFLKNGVELPTSALDERTGTFIDPDCRVGYSRSTLFWNASPVTERPWHSGFHHLQLIADLVPGVIPKNASHILNVDSVDVAALWELAADQWVFINRGAVYTTNVSRKLGAGYIRSMSVSPPLIMNQVGYDGSYSSTSMTGHVHLRLSQQYSILGSATFNAAQSAGSRFVMFRNNNNKPVVITNLIAHCTRIEGSIKTPPKINVGTADGFVGVWSAPYRQVAENWELNTPVKDQVQVYQIASDRTATLVRPSATLEMTLANMGKVVRDEDETPGRLEITVYAAGYVLR